VDCSRHRGWIAHGLVVIVAVLLGGLPVWGQTSTPLGSFGTLTLTIGIPDRQFLVLEPIPITLVLENSTTHGVQGHMALEFLARRIEVVIQPEGSEPYRIDDLTTGAALVDIPARIIKPGEKREVTEVLGLGLDQILPRPGRYAIHVVLNGLEAQSEVTSNPMSIHLREPDRFEREAYDFIVATGAARYFFTARVEDLLIAQRDEVAERFGATPYGDYANLLLGEYSASRRDAVNARKYLSRIAGKPEFPLAERAAKRLAGLGSR
jgi:hypothetical protein